MRITVTLFIILHFSVALIDCKNSKNEVNEAKALPTDQNSNLSPILDSDISDHNSTQTRNGKIFSLFTVVKFANDDCTTLTNDNGTCYSSNECLARG